MAIQILDRIPEEMTLGDTIKFKKSLADFLFSAGWTLTYYFAKDDGTAGELFNVEATQYESTEDYLVTIPAATTSGTAAGRYVWRAKVSLSGEVSTVDQGSIELLPAYTSAVDSRSDARKVVEAIDAAIAGTASVTQKRIRVRDREIEKYATTELLPLRTYYAALVRSEENKERRKQDRASKDVVKPRFTNN